MIKIKEPIWKNRSVGIAENKIVGGMVEVEILYTDKQGNRVFPAVYRMPAFRVRAYPTQIVARGVKLHVVPINDFEATQIAKPSGNRALHAKTAIFGIEMKKELKETIYIVIAVGAFIVAYCIAFGHGRIRRFLSIGLVSGNMLDRRFWWIRGRMDSDAIGNP